MDRTAEKAGHVARETKNTFGALANETRLSILCLLAEKDMNVSELAEALGVGQTVVSHSLRILTVTGFVTVRQQGHFRYHSLNKEFAGPFLRTIGFGENTVPMTQHLSEVFEHAPITLSAIDKDGTYTLVSGGVLTKFGFREEDFLGKNAFIVNQHVPATVENLRRALAGEKTNWISVSGEIAFNITAIPRHGKDGEITGALSIAMEMPRVDMQVKNAAVDAWKLLAQGTPDVILQVNPKGVIMAANHDFQGAKREDLLGVEVFSCLPEICHGELRSAIERTCADRTATTAMLQICPKTGVAFECRVFPVEASPYSAMLVIRLPDAPDAHPAERVDKM